MIYTLVVVDSARAIPARRRHLVRCIYQSGGRVTDFGDVLLMLGSDGTPRAVYQFVVGLPDDLVIQPVDIPGAEADTPDDVRACTCDPALATRAHQAANWWNCEYTHAPAVPGPLAGTGWVAGPADWPRAPDTRLN